MPLTIENQIAKYLVYCKEQKLLSLNSLRAYRIDFLQFEAFLRAQMLESAPVAEIKKDVLCVYIAELLAKYTTRTCKRKIASIKAFFNYLEYEDIIEVNPFRKIRIKFQEPQRLPKTMSTNEVETVLRTLYTENNEEPSITGEYTHWRNVACIEMLFSTGMRVGELCSLRFNSIELSTNTVRIIGKGNKERIAYIASADAIWALKKYKELRESLYPDSVLFFTSNSGCRLSEDAVRKMVHHKGSIVLHRRITPHMFRHTFASLLLSNNVDIKIIQELLGHSSIATTQIYLHLTTGRLKEVLKAYHPRCFMNIGTQAIS
jgi:integrase/recombinase XerD